MAQIIPDVVPSKATAGERKLFHVLRARLPEDHYVWYEPLVRGRLPDFVILGPDLGLLVLEAKGWFADEVIAADSYHFRVRRRGHEAIESQPAPLRQARDYVNILLDRIRQFPNLCHESGRFAGRPVFWVGCGAVMSNISRDQAEWSDDGVGLDAVLEPAVTVFRDELTAWESIEPDALVRRLQQIASAPFTAPRLTRNQVRTIRGFLHPEVIIRDRRAEPRAAPGASTADDELIVALDHRQELMARTLGDGHRVLYGVAGSGKTVMLMARAKWLAREYPDHLILVLCYNKVLAGHLRSSLHGGPDRATFGRIAVMHFHDWAKQSLGHLGFLFDYPRELGDAELGRRLLAALQAGRGQRYDVILVDEAHAFEPGWFTCCVAALRDADRSHLLIVADGSQSLYKRGKFTWKSVGVNAQGRTVNVALDLDRNYRNTAEIVAAAWQMLPANHRSAANFGDDPAFPLVVPTQAVRRGPRPILVKTGDPAARASECVRLCLQLGYRPDEIALLYRWKPDDGAALTGLINGLKGTGSEVYWVTASDQSKAVYSAAAPGVRLCTIASALGLEFRAVVIVWVDQFAADCDSADPVREDAARKTLYVGMTRAREQLFLLFQFDTPFTRELRGNRHLYFAADPR